MILQAIGVLVRLLALRVLKGNENEKQGAMKLNTYGALVSLLLQGLRRGLGLDRPVRPASDVGVLVLFVGRGG